MSDEKMVMLKSALGGYSKKDVNKYIEKISLDFARREDELKAEAENQRRAVSDAKQRTEELSRMLDERARRIQRRMLRLKQRKTKTLPASAKKSLRKCLTSLPVGFTPQKSAKKSLKLRLPEWRHE